MSEVRLIDISQPVSQDTPEFPGDYKTVLKKDAHIEALGYNSHILKMCLHTGTHIDTPLHICDSGRAVADYELECFMGPGVVLDVRGEEQIRMKAECEKFVHEGCVALIWTGFDERLKEASYFDCHPVIHEDLADFFASRRVKIVGLDMPSPDYAPYNIHRILLTGGVLILENLRGLGALRGVERFDVLAIPLKIDADSCPVRAFCVTYGI